jgi:anaerobic magnesium-protoporphyrin IX monomethyl ester cyclase
MIPSQPRTAASKRIVLFLPHRANPDEGVRVSADLLPLELLQIATYPAAAGYEIHLVDAMVHEDYLERLMQLCDGAMLLASSCILGYQVTHGAQVVRQVRERYPNLPVVWGGWFPSVVPELYLREGLADAVGLGQGEETFGELVEAIANGTPLDDVAGLALLRDNKVHYTPHRAVVGFENIPPVPWHLMDFEAYVERQNNPGRAKIRHRLPLPPELREGKQQVRGFSYFSSYGCPEPCTFCCSPLVTGRRWKAIPARQMADDVFELQERYRFNVLRFQDANFGVAEKRSNEWCDALIDAGAPFWWNGTYEIETIARYKEESCDKLRDSKCHLIVLGAEAGSQAQQAEIKKKIDLDHNLEFALRRVYERGIQTGTTWIIGYPGESRESMLDTIRLAAQMKERFPGSASDIFPFRAIPGSEEFEKAVAYGYQAPRSLEDWGSCLEYKYEYDDIGLPLDVLSTWKRYGSTATFYDGYVREGSGLVRKALQRISGWRLRHGFYSLPVEQKLFDLYVRMTRQTEADKVRMDRTSGVTPNPVQ